MGTLGIMELSDQYMAGITVLAVVIFIGAFMERLR